MQWDLPDLLVLLILYISNGYSWHMYVKTVLQLFLFPYFYFVYFPSALYWWEFLLKCCYGWYKMYCKFVCGQCIVPWWCYSPLWWFHRWVHSSHVAWRWWLRRTDVAPWLFNSFSAPCVARVDQLPLLRPFPLLLLPWKQPSVN